LTRAQFSFSESFSITSWSTRFTKISTFKDFQFS